MRNNRVAIAQLRFQHERPLHRPRQEAVDIKPGSCGQHIAWVGKVVDPGFRHDAQCDLAVNAAEGHVVNLVPERRNIGALRRIELHAQHVLPIEVEVRCQLEREWRVPALVLAQRHSVDPHRGGGHCAFEIDKNALPPGSNRQPEAPPVRGNKFVVLIVEAVPWHAHIAVGQHHAAEMRIIETRRRRRVELARRPAPAAVHWQNLPAACRSGRRRRLLSCGVPCMQSRRGQQAPGGPEKVASIHHPVPEGLDCSSTRRSPSQAAARIFSRATRGPPATLLAAPCESIRPKSERALSVPSGGTYPRRAYDVAVSVAVAGSSPGELAVTRIIPARAVVWTTARHSPLKAFRTVAL